MKESSSSPHNRVSDRRDVRESLAAVEATAAGTDTQRLRSCSELQLSDGTTGGQSDIFGPNFSSPVRLMCKSKL